MAHFVWLKATQKTLSVAGYSENTVLRAVRRIIFRSQRTNELEVTELVQLSVQRMPVLPECRRREACALDGARFPPTLIPNYHEALDSILEDLYRKRHDASLYRNPIFI